MLSFFACLTAVVSFFGILGIAKNDVFADVDRVTHLKQIMLDVSLDRVMPGAA